MRKEGMLSMDQVGMFSVEIGKWMMRAYKEEKSLQTLFKLWKYGKWLKIYVALMVSESGISEEINGEELLELFAVLELHNSL